MTPTEIYQTIMEIIVNEGADFVYIEYDTFLQLQMSGYIEKLAPWVWVSSARDAVPDGSKPGWIVTIRQGGIMCQRNLNEYRDL